MAGKAIFLNGVSSAGKTTLAKALQKKSKWIFYHLLVDDFVYMAGERACEEDLKRVLLEAVVNFAHTARTFCSLGRNIIIDTVCVNDGVEMLLSLAEELKEYPVLLVKVDCDIEELERREKQRGDRHIGQARRQVENSHAGIQYDVTVNTSEKSIEGCAEEILALFEDMDKWKGFRLLDPADYKYWIDDRHAFLAAAAQYFTKMFAEIGGQHYTDIILLQTRLLKFAGTHKKILIKSIKWRI